MRQDYACVQYFPEVQECIHKHILYRALILCYIFRQKYSTQCTLWKIKHSSALLSCTVSYSIIHSTGQSLTHTLYQWNHSYRTVCIHNTNLNWIKCKLSVEWVIWQSVVMQAHGCSCHNSYLFDTLWSPNIVCGHWFYYWSTFLDVLCMLELCSIEWQMKRSVKPKGANFFQHKVALFSWTPSLLVHTSLPKPLHIPERYI